MIYSEKNLSGTLVLGKTILLLQNEYAWNYVYIIFDASLLGINTVWCILSP